MSRENVRIDLPVGDAPGTVRLVGLIIDRNTTLALTSPIKDDFDWVTIAANNAANKTLITEANAADRESQSKHYEGMSLMGTAPGQNLETKGTLYYTVTKIRDILLVKNQTNPEALSVWGFDVVVDTTGGRRDVRVDLHTDSPETFMQLCAAIIEQNTTLGLLSPLNGKIDMAVFATTVSAADDAFGKAEGQRALKEAKNGQVMVNLGYGEGQTSETPDTTYNFITNARDLLLVAYSDNPEELSLWGYNVVVSATGMGGDKGVTPAPPAPPVG